MTSPEAERILTEVLKEHNRQLKAGELAKLAVTRTKSLSQSQLLSEIWNLVAMGELIWTRDRFIRLPTEQELN